MRLVGWGAVLAEDVPLDLPHVVLEALDDRVVGLDDVEQGGLQHGARAAGQALGVLLEVVADVGQRRGLAVADAEQVVAPGEEEQLAELDLLPVVDVPRRRHDGEQAVAVALDLRAVVLVAGIGDRQLRQVEGVTRRVEFDVPRHPQSQPAEPGAAALRRQLLDRIGLEGPTTLDVCHAASTITGPCWHLRCRARRRLGRR